jgi:Flp pilus assembly protein TadG
LKNITARRKLEQGGNVIIEMGLCMVVLFMMIFGIVEYSVLNFANNFCAYAAQQAARYASIRGASSVNALPTNPSPCGSSCTNEASGDPTTTYIQGLAVGLNTANLTVATTWTACSGCSNGNDQGSTVTVKVSYAYSPLFKVVSPNSLTLNSSSTMTVIE